MSAFNFNLLEDYPSLEDLISGDFDESMNNYYNDLVTDNQGSELDRSYWIRYFYMKDLIQKAKERLPMPPAKFMTEGQKLWNANEMAEPVAEKLGIAMDDVLFSQIVESCLLEINSQVN